MPKNPESEGSRLITLKQIEQEHGVSRSALHTYRRSASFPQPVQVEGSTKIQYRAEEVAAWFEANPPQQGKRTDLTSRDEGAAMPPTDVPTSSRTELVDAAAALLIAAITFRDIVSAFDPQALAEMPDDIRGRVTRPDYQEAFDRLPVDIRAEARALVDADPDIIAAREL
ncbi:MAG: AlpA family phage regulatory protein [Catenulispora sp.]|nr:AlpA family phage regulatory protein [Catenulispora sp.]